MAFEDIEPGLERLREKYNLPDRGHAVALLKQLYDQKQIPQDQATKEFLDRETGPLRALQRFGETAAKTFSESKLGKLAAMLDPTHPYTGSEEVFPDLHPEDIYSGPELPRVIPRILGGGQPVATVAGEAAGLTPEFSLAEALVGPAAGLIGGRAARLAPELLTNIKGIAPEELASTLEPLIAKYGPKLARAETYSKLLERGGAGGIVGYAEGDPEHPIKSTLTGIGLGIGVPALLHDLPSAFVRRFFSKPIGPDFLTKPQGNQAAEYIARARKVGKQSVIDDWMRRKATIGDVQTELAGSGLPPLDPRHFATADEINEFFGPYPPDWVQPGPVAQTPMGGMRFGGREDYFRPPRVLSKSLFKEDWAGSVEASKAATQARPQGAPQRTSAPTIFGAMPSGELPPVAIPELEPKPPIFSPQQMIEPLARSESYGPGKAARPKRLKPGMEPGLLSDEPIIPTPIRSRSEALKDAFLGWPYETPDVAHPTQGNVASAEQIGLVDRILAPLKNERGSLDIFKRGQGLPKVSSTEEPIDLERRTNREGDIRWNPLGTFFALKGQHADIPDLYGKYTHYRTLKPGSTVVTLDNSWSFLDDRGYSDLYNKKMLKETGERTLRAAQGTDSLHKLTIVQQSVIRALKREFPGVDAIVFQREDLPPTQVVVLNKEALMQPESTPLAEASEERKGFANVLTRTLKNEKGAFSFGPGKVDFEAFKKDLGMTEPSMIPTGMNLKPEETLGTNITDELRARPGILKYIRPIINVMSKRTETQREWILDRRAEQSLIIQGMGKEMRRVGQFAKNLSKEDSQKVFEAARTLRLGADNKYTQTAKGVDPRINEIATKLRKIDDRLWVTTHGYDPVVSPIFAKHGLVDDAATLQHIMNIQRDMALPPSFMGPRYPAYPHEVEAAKATRGLISIGPTHDLSYRYPNTFWYHNALADVEATLRGEIAELEHYQRMYGEQDPRVQELAKDIELRKQLIANTDREIKQRTAPSPKDINLQKVPQQASGATLAFNRAIQPTTPETVEQLWQRVALRSRMNRYHNIVLHNGWEALRAVGEGDKAAQQFSRYIRHYMNTVRGTKAAHDNAKFLRLIHEAIPSTEKFVTEDWLQEISSDLLKLRAMTALNFSPRFGIVNQTQPIFTTWPVVGTRKFFQAYLTMLSDFFDFVAMKGTQRERSLSYAEARKLSQNSWVRALANGTIDFEERFIRDAEAMAANAKANPKTTAFTKMADWMSTFKGNPFYQMSKWSEMSNRVHAMVAGELAAQDPSFNMKLLKAFVEPEKLYPEGTRLGRKNQTLRENLAGQAMVELTQFGLGKGAKPTAFSGGVLNQSVGQFQTFGIAYTELFKDLMLHARTDLRPAVRALSVLAMLGGLGALPLYNTLRSLTMRNLGWAPPDITGMRLAWDASVQMLGYPGAQPPIDVDLTYSLNPFPNPVDADWPSVIERLGGATIGTVGGMIGTAWKEGPLAPQTTRAVARGVLGSAFPYLETAAEIARGGVIEHGKKTIARLGTPQLMARLANLAPTVTSWYYGAKDEIKDAMIGENYDRVREIVDQAYLRHGLIITGDDLHEIASHTNSRAKKIPPRDWTDYILPR